MNTNSRNVTYSTVGDYQLPNLTLPQQEKALGKYGRLRRTYLMKHRPVLYNSMLLSGTLHAETEKTAELMDNVSKLYEELISFSDLYDSASFEAKKMIVNQLIRRVDVYRGYQLNITFNFDLTPYIEGDDAAAC